MESRAPGKKVSEPGILLTRNIPTERVCKKFVQDEAKGHKRHYLTSDTEKRMFLLIVLCFLLSSRKFVPSAGQFVQSAGQFV